MSPRLRCQRCGCVLPPRHDGIYCDGCRCPCGALRNPEGGCDACDVVIESKQQTAQVVNLAAYRLARGERLRRAA